jgi:8-oxo-dGTP diphosphatase
MAVDGGAGQSEIRAAGAVVWRPGAGGPQVALVHRSRYDDWSLPKGKRQPGEHLLLTAVREVAEETGVRVVLGRRLPSTHYERDGRAKTVDYWAARPADGVQPGFTPNDEVDQVDWLDVPAARARLSYAHDVSVIDEFAAGPPDTIPLILVRHASAGSREAWRASGQHDDLARPLDAEGSQQAEELARLLLCFPAGRVVSSAAERCMASVRPYAEMAGLPVLADPAFTVGQATTDDAARRIEEILRSGLPTVICGHRENLPVLLENACARLGAKRPEDPSLPLAGFWVLHIGRGTLVTTERHHLVAA